MSLLLVGLVGDGQVSLRCLCGILVLGGFQWLDGRGDHPCADEVAFQLAVYFMHPDPDRAREIAAEVTGPELAKTINEILSRESP